MPKPSASFMSWRFSAGAAFSRSTATLRSQLRPGSDSRYAVGERIHRAHHHFGTQTATTRKALPQFVVAEIGRFNVRRHAEDFVEIFEAEIHALPRERVQHSGGIAHQQHARRRLEAARDELFEREAEAFVDGADGAEARVDAIDSGAR